MEKLMKLKKMTIRKLKEVVTKIKKYFSCIA